MNTYDGRGPDGTPCVFPFEAYGSTHYGCTRLQSDGESLYDYYWCATTPDFSPGGPWKKCSLGMWGYSALFINLSLVKHNLILFQGCLVQTDLSTPLFSVLFRWFSYNWRTTWWWSSLYHPFHSIWRDSLWMYSTAIRWKQSLWLRLVFSNWYIYFWRRMGKMCTPRWW